MKAILSNLNLDPLRALYRSEPLLFSGYNQLLPTLLDPNSGAHPPGLEAALVFLDGEELLGAHLFELPGEEAKAAVLSRLDEVLAAATAYARRISPVPVVLSTVVLPPERFLRFLEANSSLSFGDWQAALNARICAARSASTNLLILDWERCVADHGYRNLYDERFFYLARVKLNQRAMGILQLEFEGLLRAHRGQARKVLSLDLDNTLWGGVVGEEGVGGVALSEDGLGKAYRDFQRALRALRHLGVLLVINSKNNEADVEEMFRHPMMVLRREDFAAQRINWEDKATNLRSLAAELGLGLDAFVTLDDSPVERDLLKTELPEVATPDFPADPALLRSWVLREVIPAHFGRVTLTAEDHQRTAQYAARAHRAAAAGTTDPQAYVRGLSIALDLRFNDPDHRARVAQLTQKTNQFNLTTRRHTEPEIEALLRDDAADVVTVSYQDRFGQEGVVGVALVRYGGTSARVDTLLLSCRVIGRGVEHHLLLAVARRARERGCERLSAEYLPTPKNAVAAGFYPEAGLVRAGTSLYEGGLDALITTLERKVV